MWYSCRSARPCSSVHTGAGARLESTTGWRQGSSIRPAPERIRRARDGKLLVVDDGIETARILARLLTRASGRRRAPRRGGAQLPLERPARPDHPRCHAYLAQTAPRSSAASGRIRQTREVPVTLFSAVSDPQVRDHLLVKGAQDFWLKGSFDFGQLRDRVNRLLGAGAL